MLLLTWEEVMEDTARVGKEIQSSGFVPEYLVGITLGGLAPLLFLAKQLGIRNVLTIAANSYDNQNRRDLQILHMPNVDLTGKRVLLVDEIVDSGETMRVLTELLRERLGATELKTAVVVKKEGSSFTPDFFARSTTEWVEFPWEKAAQGDVHV
ncbi:MAG: hypothetical protein RIQ56_62 [Candidatus Parcubacteria bacterium]|jgi:hypoxanthine phosphoribosyltransferase